MPKEKIAVVGASIAGCAAAIVLQRVGYDIHVFERSKITLEARGAGIVLPLDLLTKLQTSDFLDKDLPNCRDVERYLIAYNKQDNKEKILTQTPIAKAVSVHWAALYNSLLKRVVPSKIHWGKEITAVNVSDKKITLKINEQNSDRFDFVFFADGYNSIGRKFLFPSLAPEFSHYIAWRGTLKCTEPEIFKQAQHRVLYYGYEKGHCLMYVIPDANAKKTETANVINWLVYENIEANHELFAKDKNAGNVNIPANQMPPKYIEYLHKLVAAFLPDLPRTVIKQTQAPFIQAINDIKSPRFIKDHIALLGDAAAVLRPHSTSGAGKAFEDVLTLSELLAKNPDLGNVLEQWEKIRLPVIENLFELSRSLGRLLVTHVPVWYDMNTQQMESLWSEAVSNYNWYIEKK